MMLLLSIESSCDETSTAVLEDGYKIKSNIVASQVEIHKRFGGVVPELASRQHLESIIPITEGAIKEAGINLENIEAVAVTKGPGLMGSLLVGLSVAKAIAFVRGIPFIGVNHLEGHLLSILLEKPEIKFPYISLVVSGGHTNLYFVKEIGNYKLLGKSVDDAAGEAFDKVAKMLGLGYPGGPVIDELSMEGDPEAIPFPRAYMQEKPFHFSFSGLKTAVLSYLKKNGLYDEETKRAKIKKISKKHLSDLAASFEKAVVDVLVDKAIEAADKRECSSIAIAGGVACNRGLRLELKKRADEKGLTVYYPSNKLCLDNAAMVGIAGYFRILKGERDKFDLDATARLEL
ncbi:MAG: tRNA (adenosine(37)-N6)-threonylcarbamoyltransferase complex transferase subunit TsaD [Candidatus Schekmanbacteria bacterium RBG_16_38_11]|uniref:tRNA N6-adenosine threonylcarbamoyltransferase n=2 Tax=Candidatus Schekmaniibacteriota TaxID=1817811 RepID=A0A1F7RC76_9BACT|nr:MAG: tRNA (adenosine(37)-N6)-threonylcarbamoyltransferase complex transferase subunit TsaD [Candidatus Schekmanbacteria bacterium GWA2_38_11]OGL44858.1 MAG: tRNA (adenosine(37)-N6)-threonylcarbamoyltransferase complex transferase subunit TsaD [Candidatus Schekmanbacteria bacterium RBG_16_38_11]